MDRLPPKVQEFYERFSTCEVCGRVFWEGSHWRSMRGMLDVLMPNENTSETEAST